MAHSPTGSLLRPEASSMVWIPYRYYDRARAQWLKSQLTVIPKSHDGRVVEPIESFRLNDEKRVIGLPIHYGLREVQRLNLLDSMDVRLSLGDPNNALRAPKMPTARNAQQQAFMNAILEGLRTRYTTLATAGTGTGKTVCALWAVAQLNATTLVIVDSHELALQWKERIHEHLQLPDHYIGMVAEGECDFQHKQIVIAIIHNLVQKQFPAAFYSHFAAVVWDEAHILGAQSFSKSLPLFNARYRLALTATPKRKDGCFDLISNQFGPPCVVASMPTLPCDVHVVTDRSFYLKKTPPRGILLNILAKCEARNNRLADLIVQGSRLRPDFLVVSERIEHLEELMRLCEQRGIPRHIMGLYTRSATSGEGTRKTQDSRVLKQVKEQARIIFATYNMIEKGVDIPRLSGGLDATPRSDAIQLIGRIRRELPGKLKPIWWTIKDNASKHLLNVFYARLRDYEADRNITVSYV